MVFIPTVQLNNGVSIPQLGYGVFQVPPQEAQAAVEMALELGYRHIDTAAAYNNESGVGAGIRASGVAREQVFVTTKLRNGDQGYESTLTAFEQSAARLGLDFIDLYLIHWPSPARNLYVRSWQAMEKLYADKVVHAIGVSNFLPEHLDRLREQTEITPAVNQLEIHPSFQQTELTAFATERGIAIEAYSPLGQGVDLDVSVVTEIARRRGLSPAQVILRWHLDRGRIAIPKSVTRARAAANLAAVRCELAEDERVALDALDTFDRIGGHPAEFEMTQIR
jgi:diketogulonate reductase-like aldo/keto reductase